MAHRLSFVTFGGEFKKTDKPQLFCKKCVNDDVNRASGDATLPHSTHLLSDKTGITSLFYRMEKSAYQQLQASWTLYHKADIIRCLCFFWPLLFEEGTQVVCSTYSDVNLQPGLCLWFVCPSICPLVSPAYLSASVYRPSTVRGLQGHSFSFRLSLMVSYLFPVVWGQCGGWSLSKIIPLGSLQRLSSLDTGPLIQPMASLCV